MRWILFFAFLIGATAAQAQAGAGSQDSVIVGKLRPRWGTYLIETYPSPAKAGSSITVQLYNHNDDVLECAVYDFAGRKMKVLYEKGSIAAGLHKFVFNANGLSTGVYFVRLATYTSSNALNTVSSTKFEIVH